jgi:hypothetical protein
MKLSRWIERGYLLFALVANAGWVVFLIWTLWQFVNWAFA